MTQDRVTIVQAISVQGSLDVLFLYPVRSADGDVRVVATSTVPAAARVEIERRISGGDGSPGEIHLNWQPQIPMAERVRRGGPVSSPGDCLPAPAAG